MWHPNNCADLIQECLAVESSARRLNSKWCYLSISQKTEGIPVFSWLQTPMEPTKNVISSVELWQHTSQGIEAVRLSFSPDLMLTSRKLQQPLLNCSCCKSVSSLGLCNTSVKLIRSCEPTKAFPRNMP